jgi:hypothetical protein
VSAIFRAASEVYSGRRVRLRCPAEYRFPVSRHHRSSDAKNLFVSEINFNDGVQRTAYADSFENPEFPDLYEGMVSAESVGLWVKLIEP